MLLCKLGKPLASFDIDNELSCQQMDGRTDGGTNLPATYRDVD